MSKSTSETSCGVNMMDACRFNCRRGIPPLAVLGLLALLTAALVFASAPSVYGQEPPAATFSPSTISDKVYTAGAAVPNVHPPAHSPEFERLRLPVASLVNAPTNTVGWDATYAITGLPPGLTMDADRIIRGTPTTANASPMRVTYTTTVTAHVDPDADGVYDDLTTSTYTESITFEVHVNAAVTFGAEAKQFFNTRIIRFQGGWENATLPTATGGTGTLTYYLIENSSGSSLVDEADGITFDTSTRTVGGTPAAAARKQWAVTYVAEDQNGSRAFGYTTIYAGGYGGL